MYSPQLTSRTSLKVVVVVVVVVVIVVVVVHTAASNDSRSPHDIEALTKTGGEQSRPSLSVWIDCSSLIKCEACLSQFGKDDDILPP